MDDRANAEVNDELRQGPVSDRSCTDIICCLGFVAFIVLAVAVNVQSFAKGDVSKVARPYDVDGIQGIT